MTSTKDTVGKETGAWGTPSVFAFVGQLYTAAHAQTEALENALHS